jgi:hypothetical protein
MKDALDGILLLPRVNGKTGVLSDGPGFAGVHGGYGTADIGRDTGEGVDVFHPLQVFAV